MKKLKFYLEDTICLRLKEESIKYLKDKKCEYLEEERIICGHLGEYHIKCEFWQLIPVFYEFCLQNPGVEPLYKYEHLEFEVFLSYFGREFLKGKENSLNVREENGKKIIKCKFNELVRTFGEYYDDEYQTVWSPFLHEINVYF